MLIADLFTTNLPLTRVAEPNESGLLDMSCHIPVPENNTMDIGISSFNPPSGVTLMYFHVFLDDSPLTSNPSKSLSILALLNEDDAISDSAHPFSNSSELRATYKTKRTFAGIIVTTAIWHKFGLSEHDNRTFN